MDTFDCMCHSFSCKRKTKRWPMVLFYNIIDTAAVACHVMYKERFPADAKTYKDRGFFNETIAKELVSEHMMRRMAVARTTQRVKLSFEILRLEWNVQSERTATVEVEGRKRKAEKKGRCCRCPRKKDRKVKQTCSKCMEYVCNEHAKVNITITCVICET